MIMSLKNKGFTLMELMIVVVIVGIFAAIAIPNFTSMAGRAREASVKSNCHTVQLAAEDFSVQNGGDYPADHDTDVSGGGQTLTDMLPGGAPLKNPFTAVASEPMAGPAAAPGEVGYEVLLDGGLKIGYTITGFGKTIMVITLQSGS